MLTIIPVPLSNRMSALSKERRSVQGPLRDRAKRNEFC